MEACYAAWCEGSTTAVAEAVGWCQVYREVPPEWLVYAVGKELRIGRPRQRQNAIVKQ